MIGFILITAIALISVTVVLLGGQPTLERLQAGQETESMLGHVNTLDQEVSSLITGAPAQTTPVWRVAQARGTTSLDETGHVWAFAVDLPGPDDGVSYRMEYSGFQDGDNQITIYNSGAAISTLNAKAFLHTGASSSDVSIAGLDASLANAASDTLTLTVAGGGDADLYGNSIEVRIFDGSASSASNEVARVWFVDTGAILWSSNTGGTHREVAYENTAIIVREGDGEAITNQPALRPPRESGTNQESLFLRAVKFNGTLSLGGQTSSKVLLSSHGNHARYNSAAVELVQIYPSPRWSSAWERLLTSEDIGYDWTGTGSTSGAPDWHVWYDRDAEGLNELSISLVETNIRVEVD